MNKKLEKNEKVLVYSSGVNYDGDEVYFVYVDMNNKPDLSNMKNAEICDFYKHGIKVPTKQKYLGEESYYFYEGADKEDYDDNHMYFLPKFNEHDTGKEIYLIEYLDDGELSNQEWSDAMYNKKLCIKKAKLVDGIGHDERFQMYVFNVEIDDMKDCDSGGEEGCFVEQKYIFLSEQEGLDFYKSKIRNKVNDLELEIEKLK